MTVYIFVELILVVGSRVVGAGFIANPVLVVVSYSHCCACNHIEVVAWQEATP
jgi:hypothetical protein